MKRKKILVVTGTRAEWGLLHPVVEEIRKSKQLTLKLLVTGMHTLPEYGNTITDVRESGVPIHCIVPVKKRQSMLSMLAEEIRGIEKYCSKERPQLMLVLGDRDEPLAGAIVAAHLNIPLAHIHGGDVTGPGVDQSNRTLITKLANLHFPATAASAKRLKALGEDEWRITVAGTPGLDLLRAHSHSRPNLAKKLQLDTDKEWLLFVLHPVSHEDIALTAQISSIRALKAFPSFERVVIYPNSDTGSGVFIKYIQKLGSAYHSFKSLPRDEYLSLLKESVAIVGNSSSGIIEANFLGTPAVDIGARQKGRERGAGILPSSYVPVDVVRAIRRAIRLKQKYRASSIPSPYGSGAAGKTIVRYIERQINNPTLLTKTDR
jgi:UDP-hydrolysing UDP-N-acetyl-D-glucosamine 2-epimerase